MHKDPIKNRTVKFVNIHWQDSALPIKLSATFILPRIVQNRINAEPFKMEIKLLSCPLCLKPHFEGVDALRTTLVSVATSHLSCPVCSETLLGLDKLTIHLFSHINNVQAPKVNHQEFVHEEINRSIDNISKKCNSEHNQVGRADSDAATKMDDLVRCDICNFSFTDKNILEMHQKLLHQTTPDKRTGVYSYHCHLCSKKFKMRGSLMVHLRVAHYGFSNQNNESQSVAKKEETEVNNTDDRVKDETTSPVTKVLQKDGSGKIQDNKQWECDVCTKLFTTKYFLKKHKRLHTGEMPYCCNLCNKSFTFQQSYHKHMLYHSSEKPYVCNECGRAFKELSTLQNHARIHSGERPFGCETCGKRFRQRVSYLVHRRIHTGVMPYKCTACNKSFRYKVSQRSHKCPMNPPGNVVRVPDSEKSVNSPQESPETKMAIANNQNNTKCIMSVDLNTGNINFIPDEQNNNANVFYGGYQENLEIKKESILLNNNEQIEISYKKADLQSAITREPVQENIERVQENGINNVNICQQKINCEEKLTYADTQQDLFSMVLSPILPEVESLCLSNSPNNSHNLNNHNEEENINVMGEKCLEEFLYGKN